MARPTPELITALRETAERLSRGAQYRWTHMGQCNCGHLAQTITQQPAAELHAQALQKHGLWADKALEYCGTSGYPIDDVLGQMFDLGLYQEDVVHLERLSDPDVLRAMPRACRPADHKNRDHVVAYLRTWAGLLEDKWLERTGAVQLPVSAVPQALVV